MAQRLYQSNRMTYIQKFLCIIKIHENTPYNIDIQSFIQLQNQFSSFKQRVYKLVYIH